MARSTKTATAKAKTEVETAEEVVTPVEETAETGQTEIAEQPPEDEDDAVVVPKVEETEEQARIMYVGPTIPGFGIQNRVSLGVPEDIQGTIDKYPILKNLFIQITDYPKAAKQIREEKGYIYSAYAKALELKQKGEI